MAATNVVHIGTYVTPDIANALRAAAKRDEIPIARWVRGAIIKRLKEQQNAKSQG